MASGTFHLTETSRSARQLRRWEEPARRPPHPYAQDKQLSTQCRRNPRLERREYFRFKPRVLLAIQQRCPALSSPIDQLIRNGGDMSEFGSIAAAKLGPSSRIMIEPCAQRRRRGDVTEPQIDGNLGLRETTASDCGS